MNRLWSRIAARTVSVALLLAGVAGGVYLGRDAEVAQQTSLSIVPVAADGDALVLKQRQRDHAAARAQQRQAEFRAAAKAATAAKAAAARARKLETKVIEEKKAAEALKNSGPVPYDGPIPSSCSEYNGSRKIGCAMMLDAGFGIAEFPCLDKLWDHESGWNYKATNRSSGAYGIPQAYPGRKMASAGSDWKTNPATQIEWGLGYVEGRYDSPCGAWNHFQENGSY